MLEVQTGGAADYDDGRVGVYLHLPFCERVCPYCDFAVLAARPLEEAVEARYVAALLAELSQRQTDFPGRRLASIYLGGGTPSLFSGESIAALVAGVRGAFDAGGEEVETTLELNPSTTEIERLPDFRAAGVNRLSVGIQSFDDAQLKRLGRAHRAEAGRRALRAIRQTGFDNVSVDLIFAGPQQELTDLSRDLDELLDGPPEHVSTYELTYEAETPFGRALASGRLPAPDEDLTLRMIEMIEARLADAGLDRYEISSYARPGFRARHNARYWQRQAVLGLGMGAHSTEARSAEYRHGARRANARELSVWLTEVEDGGGTGVLEPLSDATARGEAVFLALRQREGLAAARFEAEFGAPPRAFFDAAISRSIERGWLVEGLSGSGDLALTAAGRLFADSVAAEFVGPMPDPSIDA